MPPDTKALLSLYDAAYQQRFSLPAPIEWGKDGKLAKLLLARYTLEQLTPLVAQFFVIEDRFIASSGYTFGVFYKCLGKLIVATHQPVTEREQMIQDYHARERDRQMHAVEQQIAAANKREGRAH